MTIVVRYPILPLTGTATSSQSTRALVDAPNGIGGAFTPMEGFVGAFQYFEAYIVSGGPIYQNFGQLLPSLSGSVNEEEALYLASGTHDSADITCTFPKKAGGPGLRGGGFVYRAQADKFKTFYLLRWADTLAELVKYVDGTQTILASATNTAIPAQGQGIVLVQGSVHIANLCGVTLTATDTSIILPGRVGVWAQAGTQTNFEGISATWVSGVQVTQDQIDQTYSLIAAVHDLAFSLDADSLSITGTQTNLASGTADGSLSLSLDPDAAAFSGTSTAAAVASVVAIELSEDTAEFSGQTTKLAGIDATLPAITGALSGLVGAGGSLGITLQDDVPQFLGGVTAVAITLDEDVVSISGVTGIAGSVDARLPAVTADLTASVSAVGGLGIDLDPLALTFAGHSGIIGAIAATLPAVRGQVTTSMGQVASLAIELDQLHVAGTMVAPLTASIAAILPSPLASIWAELGATSTWRALSMNVGAAAVTEYSNYQFNSFAEFNGQYLAAGAAGIYLLSGSDDDGMKISASATTPVTDGNTLTQKRPADAYAHYRSPQGMVLTVFAEGESYDYELPASADRIKEHKTGLGKGLKSVRHQYKLANREGADFELSVLSVMLNDTGRRV